MNVAANIAADELLAHRLGLSWRNEGMVAAQGVSFQVALAAGIAPLDEQRSGFRIALAPTEQALRAAAHHDLKDRSDIVVMPTAAFRNMLRQGASAAIAETASFGLERRRPGLSSMTGMSRRQWIAGIIFAASLAAGLFLFPAAALVILAVLTTPVFAALVVLRLGAVIDGWQPAPVPALPMPNARLPVYTVLVPLYREAEVLEQLIAALLALDYPPDRLDIKILVEQDDAATLNALSRRVLPAHVDVVIAPPGLPRTKPRALNIGLMEARGELLTIFDAEDRPDPRQLRLSASLFARHPAEVACLQGRLVIDNADDSLLSRGIR